jgi:hypothetical protein
VPAAHYVFAYLRKGELDQAFVWLPKMVDERNWFALYLRVNPTFDVLRGDRRFEQLIKHVVRRLPVRNP